MLATNLRILAVVLGTVVLYTMVAGAIPQVESEVPEELTFTGEITPEALVAAGEELYNGAGGCTACHGLGTRAPNLLTDERGTGPIGARCGTRVPGKSCKEYLFEAMTSPNAYVVEGYEPIMPDVSRTLSPAQVWSIIAYLQSLGGEVTVTAEDVGPAGDGAAPTPAGAPGAASGPAGTAAGPSDPATLDPLALLRNNQCLVCHRLGEEGGPIGPPFDGIGARLDADALRRAILDPNADTAKGYEAVAGTMPTTFGQQLTAAQLEALVGYLATLK
jgi:mono/diheme cytochrome c family protein